MLNKPAFRTAHTVFVLPFSATATHIDTSGNTNTVCVDTSCRRAFIMHTHTNHQWRDASGMQRQHGPWVPTVISLRMAAVTEWVFSPLNSKTALWVFLILALFRWCVGKEGSPLCQAARLKSKVGSGCIWVVCLSVCETERGMTAQCTNCLDPCFCMIPRTNNVSWQKKKNN